MIAPFFKYLGLIDQWGNGLKLIADELHEYRDIELKWQESGLQFQLQFIKKNFVKETEKNAGLAERLVEGLAESQKAILRMVEKKPTISKKEMAAIIGISTTALDKNIKKLKEKGLLKRIGTAKDGQWVVTEGSTS